MSNTQAAANLSRFEYFVKQRNEESDWEDYTLPNRLDLNKKMIARHCDFDRKRITENSKIKTVYDNVKKALIQKGILIEYTKEPSVRHSSANISVARPIDKRLLKQSQETHAALEEELYQVKKDLSETQRKLKKLKYLEDYMLATGRL